MVLNVIDLERCFDQIFSGLYAVILRETWRCTEETDILNELKLPVICGAWSNINDRIFFFMIERDCGWWWSTGAQWICRSRRKRGANSWGSSVTQSCPSPISGSKILAKCSLNACLQRDSESRSPLDIRAQNRLSSINPLSEKFHYLHRTYPYHSTIEW